MGRRVTAAGCLGLLLLTGWFAGDGSGERKSGGWTEVAPGVLRSPSFPSGYALIDGKHALLIDAPCAADGLKDHGVETVDAVLLSHHHRDTATFAGHHLKNKVPVRAAKAAAEWLTPEGVRKYWNESLPLRSSRTAYLVLAEGLNGIDCSLADGDAIDWRGWTIRVAATPGHSRDHLAFAARKGKDSPLLVFCGDALASDGKVWSPYTTDWDHWTDAGLKPTHESLRKLAELKPDRLLPAHGDPIAADCAAVLKRTADAVAEVAFLKSFERYTKQRLGDAPKYAFLAKEQAESNGSKPWSRISDHLFLTGNTYVLTSTDGPFLVVDPWDPHSAKQIPKLKADQKLGKLEVVLCSHAHYDHYDGAYSLPDRDTFEVWTLDSIAVPLGEPYRLRAPFLDARPLKVDRRPKEGDKLTWREYTFKFHHLPGQTEFTMGVETTIDGKRCLFTADNFFHQDQFSGTGGWMGLNRSWPLSYAASAQKVLDAAPEWVLAEHGGAMEFSAEDFRRRVKWGKECAKAADAISPSGSLLHDWNPHRVRAEPIRVEGKPGKSVEFTLKIDNPLGKARRLNVTLEGRGAADDQSFAFEVPAGGSAAKAVTVKLSPRLPAGRHILPLTTREGVAVDPADAFLAVDVAE